MGRASSRFRNLAFVGAAFASIVIAGCLDGGAPEATKPAVAAVTSAPAAPDFWQLRTTFPVGRRSHAAAYDSARGVMVMFGGYGRVGFGENSLGDTWEWDGRAWAQRGAVGPSPGPRAGHAMAYDAARGKVVLFGGSGLGDTWEWDGSVWSKRADGGPAPRQGHAMVYDVARRKVVLFGGERPGIGNVNDTWEWDGATWTPAPVGPFTQPWPRAYHAMGYDAARDRVVMFGGLGTFSSNSGLINLPMGDTWEWDGGTWTQRASGGPSERSLAGMTYDAARGRMVLFGGWGRLVNGAVTYLGDTWEWDGATWTAVSYGGPAVRYGGVLTFDNARGKALLFGGASVAGRNDPSVVFLGDKWEWDGASWTSPRVDGPPPGHGNPIAFDSARGKTVLFNGDTWESTSAGWVLHIGETWEWDGAGWARPAPAGSSPGAAGGMAFDAARGKTVLFNGGTWEWDGASWTNRTPTGISPPSGGPMVFDSARGKILLFNGDTWEWDGISWTNRVVSGPQLRANFTMAFDARRGQVVLFGGHVGNIDLSDTWEWDGTSWRLALASPPSGLLPRGGAAMAYDAGRGKVVLFGGGFSVFQLNDTWEWDGATWTQIATPNAPAPRTNASMVYDTTRGRLVVFGGYLWNGVTDEVWESFSFGGACTTSADCGIGSCVDGVCCDTKADSCGGCQACNVPGAVGTCAPANGGACDDANACTRADACVWGVCTGTDPVICPEGDACNVGSCDPGSGACVTTISPEGTRCADDGNACTADICAAGVCGHPAGNAGTICRAAAGPCDVPDACDGVSSACGDAKLPADTACASDGWACSRDVCDGASNACQHPFYDVAPPIAGGAADQVVVGSCASAPVEYPHPWFWDMCDIAPSVVCTPIAGNDFGDHLVTCTGTDASGNAASLSFHVLVLEPLAIVVRSPLSPSAATFVKVGSTVSHRIAVRNCQGADVTGMAAASAKLEVSLECTAGCASATVASVAMPKVKDGSGALFQYDLGTKGYVTTAATPTSSYVSRFAVSYDVAPGVVAGAAAVVLETK